MRTRTALLVVATILAAFTVTPNLRAQPLVNIETVMVGDPGNAADTIGFGAVAYEFNIGKYEVTISQYATFLNSVASVTSDSYIIDLWSFGMETDLNVAGIGRSGAGTIADPYVYTEIGPFGLTPLGASSAGSRPISYVSWFDAARFANWVHNGATNGASTETGAYTLSGATSGNAPARNPEATWWIPTADEWYKSAFYKGGGTNAGYWAFPTQSNVPQGNVLGSSPNQANFLQGPVPYEEGASYIWSVTQVEAWDENQNYLTDVGAFSGSASAYGTFDQAGNLLEWSDLEMLEETLNGNETMNGMLGRSWNNIGDDFRSIGGGFADYEGNELGFRIASVPEPSTYALLLMTGAGALWWARRRR